MRVCSKMFVCACVCASYPHQRIHRMSCSVHSCILYTYIHIYLLFVTFHFHVWVRILNHLYVLSEYIHIASLLTLYTYLYTFAHLYVRMSVPWRLHLCIHTCMISVCTFMHVWLCCVPSTYFQKSFDWYVCRRLIRIYLRFTLVHIYTSFVLCSCVCVLHTFWGPGSSMWILVPSLQ